MTTLENELFAYRVVYRKVVETKKAFMREVTPVEPQWIKEFAPSTYRRRLRPVTEDDLLEEMFGVL